ncbi:MAG: glycosyltransferase family 1 protein [Gemmatimonadota bacterium]
MTQIQERSRPRRRLKIALDLTCLLPVETGVDRFVLNLIGGLSSSETDNDYVVVLNRGDEERLPPVDSARWTIVPVDARNRASRLFYQQAWIARRARREGANLLHSLSFLAPLRSRGLKQLLTVHDMTFFTRPELHTRLHRSVPFRWLVSRSIDAVDHVMVPTRSVREDLLRLHPGRASSTVSVNAHGVDPRFVPASAADVRRTLDRLRLPSDYILFVGTLGPRKNLDRLVEACKQLWRDGFAHDLVLAGQWGDGMDSLRRAIGDPRYSGRVHTTGYLSQADLAHVYAGARVFTFPSLDEGFGLPPLEAMAIGVPVIAANCSALSEVYGSTAVMVDADNSGELAAAIQRLSIDEGLRAQKTRLGAALASELSWQRTARRTLDTYEAICE